MDKKLLKVSLVLFLLALMGISFTSNALAAQKYLVGVQVYHFGELIAEPVLKVEADQTAGGHYTVPGEKQYKIVVLVRPMADDQVSVSLQFSSGKLNIQPNLLVDIGKETSATIDKVRLVLLVQNGD